MSSSGNASPDQGPDEAQDLMALTIHYHQKPIAVTLPLHSTISDLSNLIVELFSIPPSNQKLLISPKPGLVRPPFKNPTLALSALPPNAKLTLIGSTAASIAAANAEADVIRARASARASALRSARRVKPTPYVDAARASANARYTFHAIAALPHLPDPSASLRYLQRLAADPGIQAAMRKHGFSVGLLTEMDPAAHTTREGRTLGLNRNRGEVVELRLRTDDGEGYRDYKVIRKTLCHELAHNVHGEHDRKFWDLMATIEEEVRRGDWTRGGQSLGGEFSRPGGEEVADEEIDGGGWTGGSYKVGGAGGQEGLSRREVLAKAAEERMGKAKDLGGTEDKTSGSDG